MVFWLDKRPPRWPVREAPSWNEWTELAFAEVPRLLNREETIAAKKILVSVIEEEDDPRLLAEAWLRLGEILEQEDSSSCGHAYRWVAEYADPVNTPGVMIDLAAYLERSGSSDNALGIYEEVAFVAADPQMQAVALFRLGQMFHRQEDRARAIACLRAALLSERGCFNPQIALTLAEILIESSAEGQADRTEWNEAEHLLQGTVETDHPDLAPAAAFQLARLRRRQDHPVEAERLCKLVITCGHPDFVDKAHALQSELIHEQLGLSSRALPEPEPADKPPAAEAPTLWIAPGPSLCGPDDLPLPRSGVRSVVTFDREAPCFVDHELHPSSSLCTCHVAICQEKLQPWPATPLRRILLAVRRLLGLADPSPHPAEVWIGFVGSRPRPDPPQEAVQSEFLWTVNTLISHPCDRDLELWLMPPQPVSSGGGVVLKDVEGYSTVLQFADEVRGQLSLFCWEPSSSWCATEQRRSEACRCDHDLPQAPPAKSPAASLLLISNAAASDRLVADGDHSSAD
jgi:tetratricopeptide (TPR) repeat protein